jgi:hypothetical protein
MILLAIAAETTELNANMMTPKGIEPFPTKPRPPAPSGWVGVRKIEFRDLP